MTRCRRTNLGASRARVVGPSAGLNREMDSRPIAEDSLNRPALSSARHWVTRTFVGAAGAPVLLRNGCGYGYGV